MISGSKTNLSETRQAADDLHRAVRAAAEARQKLARATRAGAPHVMVSRELRWAEAVLQARAPQLARLPGVIGFGLGRVVRNGTPTGEPCITVFVRRKKSLRDLSRRGARLLPRTFSSRGRRIRVDVVELGGIELHTFVGASIGPTNHPHHPEGTIGAFARDLANGATVGITAMHVSGLKELPPGSTPVPFSVPSPMRHDPNMTRLGLMTFGTRTGIDAAKIELDDPSSASQEIPSIGPVAGWRPVAVPGDESLSVRLFGAVSGFQRGTIIHPSVELPGNNLDAVILAHIPTESGDSGAALVDPENLVLGFLVGRATSGPYNGMRIFSPAGAVLNVLNCDF
jgi:hypothetical protein